MTPEFHGVFCKTKIIGQLRKWNENFHFILLTARWLLFCKILHEIQGSQSKFYELNIYIYPIYIYLLYIYIYIYIYIYMRTATCSQMIAVKITTQTSWLITYFCSWDYNWLLSPSANLENLRLMWLEFSPESMGSTCGRSFLGIFMCL